MCIFACVLHISWAVKGKGKPSEKTKANGRREIENKKKCEKERNFNVGGQVTNSNSAIQRPHVRRDESQKCQINVS